MVRFYKPKRGTHKTRSFVEARIESLDIRCRGVAHQGGKVWFTDGVLPGEEVTGEVLDEKASYGELRLQSVRVPSPERLEPQCPFFGKCGGCSLQFMKEETQLDAKKKGIRQVFSKNAGIDPGEPELVVSPVSSGYRRCIRLSTLFDTRHKVLLVGLRARGSHDIVPVDDCMVLTDALRAEVKSGRITKVLNAFTDPKVIGHIEFSEADNGIFLLVRIKNPLPEKERDLLQSYEKESGVTVYTDSGDGQGAVPVREGAAVPFYTVRGVRITYLPGDFIQVNGKVNEEMVGTVEKWLAPTKDDEVLDLFAGAGNFTYPLAALSKRAVGAEIVSDMVKHGRANAGYSGIANAEFVRVDLSKAFSSESFSTGSYSLAVLDPGRSGADVAVKYIAGKKSVKRFVYVSCNPVMAARDLAGLLGHGWKLSKWGMFNMFPETEHVETVVLLSRDKA